MFFHLPNMKFTGRRAPFLADPVERLVMRHHALMVFIPWI